MRVHLGHIHCHIHRQGCSRVRVFGCLLSQAATATSQQLRESVNAQHHLDGAVLVHGLLALGRFGDKKPGDQFATVKRVPACAGFSSSSIIATAKSSALIESPTGLSVPTR